MIEFARTKMGQTFCFNVARIADAVEALASQDRPLLVFTNQGGEREALARDEIHSLRPLHEQVDREQWEAGLRTRIVMKDERSTARHARETVEELVG